MLKALISHHSKILNGEHLANNEIYLNSKQILSNHQLVSIIKARQEDRLNETLREIGSL
jgi:hypothetical protein